MSQTSTYIHDRQKDEYKNTLRKMNSEFDNYSNKHFKELISSQNQILKPINTLVICLQNGNFNLITFFS